MMELTITGYKNTGFNAQNVPYSALLLNEAGQLPLPAVWLLQDRYKSTVKVSTTYETIKDIDYCKIGTTYYFVNSLTMRNENMCELELTTDFVTTIGIANLGIVSGWCTRRCVTDDTLFSNTIEEDFTPIDRLTIDMGKALTNPSNSLSVPVIASTVNLKELKFTADTYEDAVKALTVTVPKLPKVKSETKIALTTPTGEQEFTLPQTGLYLATRPDIQNAVQSVRSLGVESAIVAAYRVPFSLAGFEQDDFGEYTKVTGKLIDADSSIPYKYGTNIKNNKVFAGQFNKYNLYSICSGDSAEYEASDIQGAGESPHFIIFVDPQPEGKPYARPKSYRGNLNDIFIGCVSGSQWQNYQMVFYGNSGQALADQSRSASNIGGLLGAITTAISSIANPASIPSALSGAVTTGYETYNANLQHVNAKNAAPPEVRFPLSPSLQNYYNNTFWVTRTRLSNRDAERYDRYLTQFGYATFEPLTLDCFQGRTHFNYVRATGVNLSNNYPLAMRVGAIQQIENGIRVWHTKPNIAAMSNNPIKKV